MRFRKGNNEKNGYTFKAGLLGLDLSAEGPIKKGQSSFLFNYRYSTLGILNALGFHLTDEREDNNFQDLSFVSSKAFRSTLRSPILPATRGRIRWTFMRPKPAF